MRLLKIGLAAWIVIGCGAGRAVESLPPEPLPAITPAIPVDSHDPDAKPPDQTQIGPDPGRITIAAVGDIMPGSVTPIPFVPSPTEHDIPAGIRRVVSDADVVFGNLEGTFIVEGMAPVKCRPETREAGRCYEFGFPPFLVSFLKDAGFTVLSLDNNHAEDYGLAGYVLTQGLLAQTALVAVPKRMSVVFPVHDIRVAFVAFGFSGRSFHVSDLETARTVVIEATQQADVVVVSFHGGAEGENASRVVDTTEEYFGEDRGNSVRFAHTVVDAGADLVLGHGPHVPRAVELYQGRLIAYSLGNFWTYGNVSIKGTKGIMPLLRVTVGRDGTFVSGRIVSMRQRLPGIPELDPEETAVRLITARSREDFPSSPLTISEWGTLLATPQGETDEIERSEPWDSEISSGRSEGGLSQPN